LVIFLFLQFQIIAFIDTQKPNNDFGGDSVPYSNYVTLFDGNNAPNVVEIDKTISRDVCGKGVRKIAMRVRAIDKDGINDGQSVAVGHYFGFLIH
jgi:hypothetical protein